MARKGIAKVKPPKNKFLTDSESDGGDDDFSLDGTARERTRESRTVGEEYLKYDVENVDPDPARELLNPSKAPKQRRGTGQPRQDVVIWELEQSKTLASDLFPPNETTEHHSQRLKKKQLHQQRVPANLSRAEANASQNAHIQNLSSFASRFPQRVEELPILTYNYNILEVNVDMAIPGGAAIPANQQRNMRACMVCSIVRTQQQFMTSGCPNCEDILELAGNSDQVNDCTSQVFEGLITVADTKKSWVARYQRLEGYVPGVYATQVEGILPEEVIVAVENAGINYVPRDGSEQEMLPKD